ncbi:MAG: DsbA family protein [Tabrizicola sp.]
MRFALMLAASLWATSTFAGGLGDMTDEERAVFREEVKAYLLENPEVIVEAMTVLQEREDNAAMQRDVQILSDNAEAIFRNPNDWVGGNLECDITIVEFMDYRCGYCRKAYAEVEELVKSDGNIRFILKELPILGEESLLSAQFAISVRLMHGDGAYKAAHDALISLRGEVNPESLARLAKDLGHNPEAVLARMNSAEVAAVISANHDLATLMEINGTPSFVIDQTMLRGYVPLEGMRQIVEGQRNEG